MELTESWKEMFPEGVQEKYLFAETRNAARILRYTSPEAFDDLVSVLENFELTLVKLAQPGGNKGPIPKELDDSFRERGWREAKFEQDLTTRLTLRGWKDAEAPELREPQVRESTNHYGGHWVDNVKDRAVVDVEWNPKDGNLDRDFGNYVSLYEGGVIDAGVLLVRDGGDEFRSESRELIEQLKAIQLGDEFVEWNRRIGKLAKDPYGTSTTANFVQLKNRVARGDGRGCPILGIGIPWSMFAVPDSVEDEAKRVAERLRISSAVDLDQGAGGVGVEFTAEEDEL